MVQLKSIASKIVLLAGVCLFTLALVIVMYSAVTMKNSAQSQYDKSIKDAELLAFEKAQRKASYIQVELEAAMDAARTIAHTLSALKNPNGKLSIDRGGVNEILKTVLHNNADFIGTYTTWEPDQFDALDGSFKNSEGHDSTGRFVPYWNRNEQGTIVMEPLVDYEKEDGSDWYQFPKRSKKECIIDPYVYPINGTPTLLTSLVVPVLNGEKFYGIAGVDFRLDFLQVLADDVEELYEGAGRIALISNNGTIAAVTSTNDLQGKMLQDYRKDFEKYLGAIKEGKSNTEIIGSEELVVFTPIKVGKSITPWSVNIVVPMGTITADAVMQMDAANSAIIKMIVTSIICVLIGMGILWMLAANTVKPIRSAVNMLKDIAEGEGDLTQRLMISTNDEISELAQYFNKFIEKIQRIIVEISVTTQTLENSSNDLNQTSGSLADNATAMTDQSTSVASATEQASQNVLSISGSAEELSSSVNIIAAAIEEMNSSLTEVAQNCQNESTIAQKASEQVNSASQQMNTLGSAATDITKIVSTINDIANQTNLLALNATIEAASAGDAGKGFAVVASEVKELAKQTADATQVITQQVLKMQDISEKSINDITDISKIINEINTISHTIVSAVDEQSATVNEISNSVGEVGVVTATISTSISEASLGLNDVAEKVKDVEQVTHNTKDGITEISESSDKLKTLSNSLSDIVGQFKIE